jgi:hypothetical protein
VEKGDEKEENVGKEGSAAEGERDGEGGETMRAYRGKLGMRVGLQTQRWDGGLPKDAAPTPPLNTRGAGG